MIPQTKILLPLCFVLVCQATKAQSNFSFGPAFSVGYPILPDNATLITRRMTSAPDRLRNQLMVANGLVMRYMLGNRFGVESGLQVNTYNYSLKNESNDLRKFLGF